MPEAPDPSLRRDVQRRWLVATAALAAVFLAALAFGWLGKAICLDGQEGFWGENRYCYSDIRRLWSIRGFDVDAIPYAGPPVGYAVGYEFEYPPLLGFSAWAIALVTETRRQFFTLNTLTLLACAVGIFGFVAARLRSQGQSPWRLAALAASPSVVLFAFQNWDLWSMLPAVLAVLAMARGRRELAAVLIGVGVGFKWWPAMLVVLLVWGPWAPMVQRGWQRHRPWVIAAGTAVLVQVPAMLVSWSGWLEANLGQLRREANAGSPWRGLEELLVSTFGRGDWIDAYWSVVSTGTSLAMVAGVVVVALRLRRGTLDPMRAAVALVAIFLLTSRVTSPQFLLWLIPFVVLSDLEFWPLLAAEWTNALTWLLHGPNVSAHPHDGWRHAAQSVGVLRLAALALVLWSALSVRDRAPDWTLLRDRSESPVRA